MKKLTAIIVIIGVLVVSAYVVVRRTLRTPGFQPPATNSAAAPEPAKSVLDLRPRLIEKLQQLVSTGSGGLYRLSIHSVEPDILASNISLKNIQLVPDSSVMRTMKAEGRLPADVFSFSLDSLRIEGLGIKELLNKDVIDLDSILLQSPHIDIYHQKPESGKQPEGASLYQRLRQQLKHLSLGQLTIRNGSVTVHQYAKKKSTRFNSFDATLTSILFDSTTENDHRRFFFAREAHLSTKNIGWRTADNLYDIQIGSAGIDATEGRLSLSGMKLVPRYGKQEFQDHIKVMTERFTISLSSAELHDVDWWNLLNEDVLEASSADISGGFLGIYLDHRKPSAGTHSNTFPHQLLMGLHTKIHIPVVNVRGLQIESEEYTTLSDQSGTLYVNDMNGTITNLTNMPAFIRKNGHTKALATATFMHGIHAKLGLDFDLANYRSGAFGASIVAGALDPLTINSLSIPMGLFRVDRGTVQGLESHIKGDNKGASGQVKFLYKKLRVSALEKDKHQFGGLNKKHITSILANVAVVKDDNPSGDGTPRVADDAQFTYDPHTSFFNLVWKTTFVGILKIIGAPKRLATAK